MTRTPGLRAWAALAVLTLAVTLLAIDSTVLALAIPSLSADLSPTASQLLWIGDIYSFTLAGLLVTMGNVADRIGRRRLLLIGTFGFGTASIMAAFAPSAGALIAARALLGVGGATIMPSTLSLIRNIFPDARHRTTAIAIWSAGSSGGTALGPLVGGVLLERFWWGSVFLINVPVMAAVIVTGLWLLPESKNDQGAPVDLASAVLSVLAIVPITYAVKSFAHDGLTVVAIAALVGGLAAGWLFIRRQRTLATPLIDVELFRRPAFTWAIAATVLAIFALAGLLYFFSQYLQLVRGYSTLRAGLTEVPASLASIVVVAVVAAVVRRLATVGRSEAACWWPRWGWSWSRWGSPTVGSWSSASVCSSSAQVSAWPSRSPPERSWERCRRTGQERPRPSPRPASSWASRWGSRCSARFRMSVTGSCSDRPPPGSRGGSPTPPSSPWPPWRVSSIRVTPGRPS